MISKSEIEKALDVRIPVSVEMEIALDDWVAAYEKKSYWIKDDVVSLSLPAIVAKETARLILTGGKSWVSGSARADYVQQQYQNYMKNARKDVEYGCALGGIILKPFLSGTEVKVDAICADRFFPISFDSDGYITDAVFIEQLTRSDKYYTRVERHSLDLKTKVYSVDNLAFVSSSPELMGSSCSLEAVPEWADYTEHVQIENCERPLFAYFKVPGANNIDRRSPTGHSYSGSLTAHSLLLMHLRIYSERKRESFLFQRECSVCSVHQTTMSRRTCQSRNSRQLSGMHHSSTV